MTESVQEFVEPKDYLMSLISTALRQRELSGLSELLKCISQAVNAYGCILWEVAPSANLESDPPEGYLYVLAEWFQDGSVFAKHDMPLAESVNGLVVRSQTPENIPNIREDARAYGNPSDRSIIGTLDLRTMCSAPVSFSDVKNALGTLSLYRNLLVPFTEEEFGRVQQMALLIPDLYQAIRDKVSRELINQVNEILHEADLRSSREPLSKVAMKGVVQRVCMQVTKTFQCIETSIFMEDPFEAANEYHLLGTTWPLWSAMKKDFYVGKVQEGITGWVLAHNSPVRIFSLGDFERDKGIIQSEYPGITWKDSLDIRESTRKILKLDGNARLPPLSFMATPIVRGGKVLGVIRCNTARNVPYYFADRELNLLRLVAVQISRFWSNWLIRREIEEEKRTWQALVSGVSQLNSFVRQELKLSAPSQRRIFNETLRVAHDVVTGADISDVRLYDPDTRELYFAATFGAAWKEGSSAEVKARAEQRFLVDDETPDRPVGVRVYHSRTAIGIFDAESFAYKSETFPQAKRIIVAPIRVQEQVIGVLDLRGTGGQAFPTYALKVTELLGQQLGLYYYLTTTIAELHQAEIESQGREKERLQTNEDLAHQLKGPVIQAHARIQAMLRDDNILKNKRLNTQSLALRGLIAKAKRVTMSTGLFAELARQNAILIEPKRLRRLKHDLAVKMLIEAAMDNELMIDPEREIRFHVNGESFEVLNSQQVSVDFDLLEQAVSCLLDNAGKYSFAGTPVEISGGLTKGQSFYVSIENQGMPIKQHEVGLCKERLWRSEQATWTTGEGSGIGLWVVDHIMKGHGGELLITPTTSKGVTQLRLIFPVGR